ncbi:hypothetical protein I3842_Q017800 [Carya illinoinensis]|uniref:Uncharacterized protein n=1 Tax=Carya illinoinensis TaxID=32201 RepID=A0A922A2L7_CARIL|nr:hypothetical protein I3842_Q017800 [Carya illinoinensis]
MEAMLTMGWTGLILRKIPRGSYISGGSSISSDTAKFDEGGAKGLYSPTVILLKCRESVNHFHPQMKRL